jgi:serine phosphatase RsbU (regulator of sigma subunit)
MATVRRSASLVRRRSAVASTRGPARLDLAALHHAIDTDPVFSVLTPDGHHWIDPFTGKRLQAVQDLSQALRLYFQQQPHWQRYPVKAMEELQFWRWVHYLNDHVRSEPRLRFFKGDGAWLNPFTGAWSNGVRRAEGRITSMTLHEMAKDLAASVLSGPAQMLPFEQLRKLIEVGPPRRTDSTNSRVRKFLDSRAAAGMAAGMAEGAGESAGEIAGEGPGELAEVAPEAPRGGASAVRPVIDPAIAAAAAAAAKPTPSEDAAPTDRARRVQARLLGEVPRLEGWDLGVRYRPCDSVGGDFYEVSRTESGELLLAVGDVTGHGVQAALVMASAVRALRFVARGRQDPVDIVATLAEEVGNDLLHEHFVTLWLALLDPRTGRLRCTCAGHHPALLTAAQPADGVLLRLVGQNGPVLGPHTMAQMRQRLRVTEVQLAPGDRLLQYTDGLTEAANADGDELGEHRLHAGLLLHRPESQDLLLDALLAGGQEWAGSFQDDITLLALTRVGG